MKLNIKVIPNSKQEKVIQEENRLKVCLKSRALEGKANKALIQLLAKHFNTKKSNINIIIGLKSRKKVVEIKNET